MAPILFEGRTLWWNGHKVVVMEKLPGGRVKIAYKNNPKMIRIVKRDELG